MSLDLLLDERLPALGTPTWVGSAALGLMVRRDLDVTVACPALGISVTEAVAELGARLAVHPRVRQVQFRDDTGHWNTDPAYPDGLCLGVEYRSSRGDDWTLDIWFVDEPGRQPDLADLRAMPPRLTPETRAECRCLPVSVGRWRPYSRAVQPLVRAQSGTMKFNLSY